MSNTLVQSLKMAGLPKSLSNEEVETKASGIFKWTRITRLTFKKSKIFRWCPYNSAHFVVR